MLEPVDPTAYSSLFQDVKTIPLISLRIWVQDYPHPQNWLSTYWTCGAFSEAYGYCDRNLDALLARADREPDPRTALPMYQQAEDFLLKGVPAAFAHYAESLYLLKPYVIGPRDHIGASDTAWAGEWGPVWTYDIDLSQVPANYSER
jgi:oligopeptide transport system substrate-binding protein